MIGTQVRTLDPSLKGNSDPSREVSYTGQYTHYCLRLVYDLPTHHVARSCHPPRLRSSGLRRTHQEGSVVAHIKRSNTTHRTMPLSGAHELRIPPPHTVCVAWECWNTMAHAHVDTHHRSSIEGREYSAQHEYNHRAMHNGRFTHTSSLLCSHTCSVVKCVSTYLLMHTFGSPPEWRLPCISTHIHVTPPD